MGARSKQGVLANLERVREGVADACARVGRDPAGVRIVAAGKTVEPEALGWVLEAGNRDLGENYVKELRAKRAVLPEAIWHFIGNLQSHTAHHVADLSDVVESGVPGAALARLARRAVAGGRILPVLVEVDLTGGRTGVPPGEALAACDAVASTPGLRLIGLMTVPPATRTAEEARPFFLRLREVCERVTADHPRCVELSMGMSLDYPVAVEEGATMVRIGTALFGERSPTG
jgi:hypothetical protein